VDLLEEEDDGPTGALREPAGEQVADEPAEICGTDVRVPDAEDESFRLRRFGGGRSYRER
jgi:hypothetical protein